jgi:S1-C subfamily serine protease
MCFERLVRNLLFLVLFGALGAMAWAQVQPWLVRYEPVTPVVTPRGELAADEKATIALFEQASPAVVYITTIARVVDLWTRNVFEVPRGTGSGFVWDNHGHIVTNWHVVRDAQKAQVRLADQRRFNAELVGASPVHDLAVLRIKVPLNPPPRLALGSSLDLKVGQKVFAIGNPFGLDHTLTSGIISALDRAIPGDDGVPIEHLIQTDAAINPGNSGGPLLDSAGRVIGVNTAIYSPSGAYAGIGFAVPIDTVSRVVPQLIAHGRYRRPALGITASDELSARVSAALGVEGVLVLEVQPGSAAARAGLRGTRENADGEIAAGDVITTVNGLPVTRLGELLAALDRYQPGERIMLGVYREGRLLQLPVTLQAPDD